MNSDITSELYKTNTFVFNVFHFENVSNKYINKLEMHYKKKCQKVEQIFR